MSELKVSERQALAKTEVMQVISVPADAVQIDGFEYAIETEYGWVKVKATAVKGDFDAEFEASEYQRKLAERAEKAEKVAKEKAEKIAKSEAKKAKETAE